MAYTLKGSDDLTDTGFTNLDAHTPTPSGGFTWTSKTPGGLIIFSNSLYNVGSEDYGLASLSLAGKQAVEFTVSDRSSLPGAVLNGVLAGGNFTGYLIRAYATFGVYLYKFTGSGVTANELTHDATSWANSDIGRAENDGTGVITIYKNAGLVLTYDDSGSSPNTAGFLGIGGVSGLLLDDFVAYDDAGGGGGSAADHQLINAGLVNRGLVNSGLIGAGA